MISYTLKNADGIQASLNWVAAGIADALEHGEVEIIITPVDKDKPQRTLTQNKALHKFCDLLSKALNDAGLDMRAVMKPEAEIPWTPENVKDNLWRPVQKAMYGKESTTELDTAEVSKVHEALMRHLGQKLGVPYVSFPNRFGD